MTELDINFFQNRRYQELLTSFLAVERAVGRSAWSWEKVENLGLSLGRAEARKLLIDQDATLKPERAALYQLLFENHRELELSLLDPKEWLTKRSVDESKESVDSSFEAHISYEGLPDEDEFDARVQKIPTGQPVIIFRLGKKGPGGLSPWDTMEIAERCIGQADFWIPVDTKASFALGNQLRKVGGRFYLAIGDQLVAELVVDQVVHNRTKRSLCPSSSSPNPWPTDVAFGWVRIVQMNKVDIPPEQFLVYTRQGWVHGFVNQSPLVRAIVLKPGYTG